MKPLPTYNGGKSASGVPQALINMIPPHDIFISAFMGNCSLLGLKRPADINIGIDKDIKIVEAWRKTNPNFSYFSDNALTMLPSIVSHLKKDVKTFVFIDPPYLEEVRSHKGKVYKYEMLKREEHTKLFEMIASLPANVMVMVTHYPCDFYDHNFKDWNYQDISSRTRTRNTIERVYMNYPVPTEALHDYTYFGQDFRKREKYNRIRKNIVAKLSRLTPLERNYILNSIQKEYL